MLNLIRGVNMNKKLFFKLLFSFLSIFIFCYFLIDVTKTIKAYKIALQTLPKLMYKEIKKQYLLGIFRQIMFLITSVFLFLVINLKDLKFLTESTIKMIKETRAEAPIRKEKRAEMAFIRKEKALKKKEEQLQKLKSDLMEMKTQNK